MSTKPIREALLKMGKAPNTPEEFSKLMEAQDAALEAVRAIEEMARFMVSVDTMRAPDADDIRNAAKFSDLLESIAKEAP